MRVDGGGHQCQGARVYQVKNWLGQDIEVGSVVGRGARAGNTSDFKIGVVTKVSPDKEKVSVAWKYESARAGRWVDTGKMNWQGRPSQNYEAFGYCPYKIDSVGHPSIEGVFLLSQSDLDVAEKMHALYEEMKDRQDSVFPMDKNEWTKRVEAL